MPTGDGLASRRCRTGARWRHREAAEFLGRAASQPSARRDRLLLERAVILLRPPLSDQQEAKAVLAELLAEHPESPLVPVAEALVALLARNADLAAENRALRAAA